MTRIQWLDILKLFAIFLVLWGHAIQYFLSTEANEILIYRVIYSFHMPLFMMVAGYFASSSLKSSFVALIKKKGIQLLLPLISWAMICSLIETTVSSEFVLFKELNYLFWFLKSLFVCYIMFYITMTLPKKYSLNKIGGGIILLISQLTNWGQLPTLYPAFLLGYLISKHRLYLEEYKYQALFISFLIWGLFIISSHLNSIELIPFKIPMQARVIEIIGKLSGAVLFFCIFYLLFKKENHSRYALKICSYGQLTMGIYILQTFILERGLGSIIKFDNMESNMFCFIVAPVLSVTLMMVCIALIKIIKLNKFASLLLLGEQIK